MKQPMFSVIIPCYNTAKWLPTCLNSLIAQDHTNFEALLINDGSTDETAKICDEFAKKESRFKVMNQPNCGVVAARHKGFQHSKGEYILFLDSDDQLKDNALREVSKILQSDRVDYLRFGFDYCEVNWETTKTIMPPISGKYTQNDILRFVGVRLKDYSSPSIWDKVYKRSLTHTIFDLLKDKHIKNSEDTLFSIFALIHAKSCYFLNESLYYYLQRPGSAIHSVNADAIKDKEIYIESLMEMHEILPSNHTKQIDLFIESEIRAAKSYVLMNCINNNLDFGKIVQKVEELHKSKIHNYKGTNYSSFKYTILKQLLSFPKIYSALLLLRKKVLSAATRGTN